VCAYPDLVASFVDASYRSLGTDGFGRSDNRASLRRFFEVDRQHIVVAALYGLAETGTVTHDVVAAAIKKYEINTDLSAPWLR
jgi:pyruvate dehydrogenase E1 component